MLPIVPGPHGRDPRRRPTVEQRRTIYARADGRCTSCGAELGHDYHNAHLAAWTNGGASDPDNVEAQCMRCNLTNGARDLEEIAGIQLRPWQADALEVILERVWQTGVATVNAAPGAGKTIFALAVYAALAQAGHVERLIVVSPNTAIIEQWKTTAGKMRIHLDDEPRDGHIELQGTSGAIVTYQVLPRSAGPQRMVADLHRERMQKIPTMVVFDEVHHIGENRSWGAAVTRMVGDVANGDVHPVAVLNMTGTLFRSGRDKRISTVRYRTVLDEDGTEKLEAQADWSITTAELLGDELRAPDLYVYSTRAELMDLRKEVTVTGDLGDLDKQQRATVLRGLDQSPEWLRGFAAEAVRLLENQMRALDGDEPLKLLYCATDIRAARLAADAINEVTGKNFARLVISDDARAGATLRDAKAERRPCAIVQVKMASEGFDCPQVSTIAYASNVTADLSIAQTMARAMRITDGERAARRLLPAQILIPDNPDLRQVFAAVLSTLPRLIDLDEPPADRCYRCDEPLPCGCPPGTRPPGSGPRYELMDLSRPEFHSANVLGHDDGEVLSLELDSAGGELNGLGIPAVYHPRAVVFGRRYRAPAPRYAPTEPEPAAGPVIVEANPRDLNRIYRSKLAKAAGWIKAHIGHDDRFDDVGQFQYLANDAAGIQRGGRPDAPPEQLGVCAQWMCDRIAEHCDRHGEAVPPWVG